MVTTTPMITESRMGGPDEDRELDDQLTPTGAAAGPLTVSSPVLLERPGAAEE
ncbi:MAG: hypothetical protein ACREDE_11740 [Thermoplasmata archaeon]